MTVGRLVVIDRNSVQTRLDAHGVNAADIHRAAATDGSWQTLGLCWSQLSTSWLIARDPVAKTLELAASADPSRRRRPTLTHGES